MASAAVHRVGRSDGVSSGSSGANPSLARRAASLRWICHEKRAPEKSKGYLSARHELLASRHDPEEHVPAAEIVVVVSVALDDEFSCRFPVPDLECVGDDASPRLQCF